MGLSDKQEGSGYFITIPNAESGAVQYYIVSDDDRHIDWADNPAEATIFPNLEVARWESRMWICKSCGCPQTTIVPVDNPADAQARMEMRRAWYQGDREQPELPELSEDAIRELQSCLSYVIDVTPVVRWGAMAEHGWDYGAKITIEGDDGAGMVWHLDRMMKILGVDETNNFMFNS